MPAFSAHVSPKTLRHFSNLGHPFLVPTAPTPLRETIQLLHLNESLSESLHLKSDLLRTETAIQTFAGNQEWPNYDAQASVYCGHQFGTFVSQLGDGRALLLAELNTPKGYQQLQLKGAGITPFSRHGDGRAVLRSSIREYLASEAMHTLGIPTTRALSLCASSDEVFRETPETAAVVCRVSPSFLRFGHLEYFGHGRNTPALRTLVSWHIQHQHPEFSHTSAFELSYDTLITWIDWMIQQTAQLIAQWQAVGFCHGVMNTDNMSLIGQTIDYGPYGFMDEFDVHHICNHSDHQGRYRYSNQPQIAWWNLQAMVQALMPLFSEHSDHQMLHDLLNQYPAIFRTHHTTLFAKKLGLVDQLNQKTDEISSFIDHTLKTLHDHHLDFTRFFRSLSDVSHTAPQENKWESWTLSTFFPWKIKDVNNMQQAWLWFNQWQAFQPQTEALKRINPAFVLRNHLLHECHLQCQAGNVELLNLLFEALSNPWTVLPNQPKLYEKAPEWANTLEISCSS